MAAGWFFGNSAGALEDCGRAREVVDGFWEAAGADDLGAES